MNFYPCTLYNVLNIRNFLESGTRATSGRCWPAQDRQYSSLCIKSGSFLSRVTRDSARLGVERAKSRRLHHSDSITATVSPWLDHGGSIMEAQSRRLNHVGSITSARSRRLDHGGLIMAARSPRIRRGSIAGTAAQSRRLNHGGPITVARSRRLYNDGSIMAAR